MLTNSIRIIGGKWRGRKLSFPANAVVRPTLAHVRETLFNWLQPIIAGSRCLDAFAGSGALGIEALSRGAAEVIFVDQEVQALKQLQQNLQHLAADTYDSFRLSLPQDLLQLKPEPYGIIFLDPPFHSDLLDCTLAALLKSNLITEKTLIYVETTVSYVFSEKMWRIHRYKKTKNIGYGLLQKA